MFYFSHLASQHQFSRHLAAGDWRVAGILEKAQKAMLGNKIQKKLEMNRPKCLELVNDLLKSEEIKNTKKGLVIND